MATPEIGPRIPVPEIAPAPLPARRPPKRPRPIWLAGGATLVLVAAGAIAFVASRQSAQDRAAGGLLPAIRAVAVSLGDVHSVVRISGTIVAERSAAIRAPRILGSRGDFNRGGGGAHDHGAGGHPDFNLTLLRLAKAGTRVKAGEIVAEFDPENQVQRLDDYRDSVVQLKNSIRKMVANLAASKEAHEQKVRTAHAAWQKALLDVKTVTVRSAIEAEKMRLTAEEADLTYRQLIAQRELVEQSQRASIHASELVLAQSAIELDRAQANVNRMIMRAPIDGIVVIGSVVLNGELRIIREGDQISPGQPVLYVVDTNSMALNGTANQVDADRLRLGMRARIGLDAYPGFTTSATLVGIGAMAKVSASRAGYVGAIPVRFRIDAADPRLLPDLTGSADVLLGIESKVPVAPRPAVMTDDGKHFVLVQEGENWIRREVALGLHSATHVAIRSGLRPGEVIAVERPL